MGFAFGQFAFGCWPPRWKHSLYPGSITITQLTMNIKYFVKSHDIYTCRLWHRLVRPSSLERRAPEYSVAISFQLRIISRSQEESWGTPYNFSKQQAQRSGGIPRNVGWFPKPLPYLWLKSVNFATLFMNWPKKQYPVYDCWGWHSLPKHKLWRAFVDRLFDNDKKVAPCKKHSQCHKQSRVTIIMYHLFMKICFVCTDHIWFHLDFPVFTL